MERFEYFRHLARIATGEQAPKTLLALQDGVWGRMAQELAIALWLWRSGTLGRSGVAGVLKKNRANMTRASLVSEGCHPAYLGWSRWRVRYTVGRDTVNNSARSAIV